ncbi:MAG TPA: MarR family winged helix-turn-helix transcriptional regulator [Sphingobium sp.]
MRKKNDEAIAGNAPQSELYLGAIGGMASYWLSVASAMSFTTFLKMVGGQSRNARYIILSLIRQNPGVTQTQLGATRFRDVSSLSPVIAEFIEDGLIRREKVFVDKRPSKALFLTEKGEELWQDLDRVAVKFNAHFERIMGPHEHVELARLLEKLSSGLIDLDDDLKRQV